MNLRAWSKSVGLAALPVLGAAAISFGSLGPAFAAPSDASPKETQKDPKDTTGKGAPVPEKPAAEKKAPAVTCTLLTTEAPRGGRLEVEGKNFGKSPVVKISGEVTRTIERSGDRIAVQIPRKSDGGAVTVRAEGQDIACGTLTIIGTEK